MKIIYDDGTEKDFGDEPVFILRGQDEMTPGTVAFYNMLCRQAGLAAQSREVNKAFNEIRAWQKANRDKVKLPKHKHQPVGQRSATGQPSEREVTPAEIDALMAVDLKPDPLLSEVIETP